ncbi:hypothetical protein BDA99DRAFT_538246 [Phascolomyces articulosus]|uniref:Uncharacterized protein n=1 Tax=Phascolomyces articulosus TaxID=60185 RepID=A0AAD5KBQ7_9FUNG|nr:hypothetical protein BDA99DRAFT_538246 [Phascolomyces articulosus]
MVYTVYDLPQIAHSVLKFCRSVLPYVVCYRLWLQGYIPTVIALVGFISLAPCCTFVRTFIVAFCTFIGLISAPLPPLPRASWQHFVDEKKEEDLCCVRGITRLRVCPEADEFFESFSQFGFGSVRSSSATPVPYFAKTPLAAQRLSLGLPECDKVIVVSSPIKESTHMEHDFEMAALAEQFDAMHLHDNTPVHTVDHMTPTSLYDEDLMSVDMPLEGDSSIVHNENAFSSSSPSVSDMELDVLSLDDHPDTHDLRHTVHIPFAPLWSLDWSLPVESNTVEDTHATDAMQVDEVFIILDALRSMLPSVDVGKSPVWSSKGDALDVPYFYYPFEHTSIVTSVPWVWSLPLHVVEDTMIDRDVHLDALSSSSEGDLPSMPSSAFEEDTPMMRPGQEGDASTEPTISREEEHTANYQSLLLQTPFAPLWSETECLRLGTVQEDTALERVVHELDVLSSDNLSSMASPANGRDAPVLGLAAEGDSPTFHRNEEETSVLTELVPDDTVSFTTTTAAATTTISHPTSPPSVLSSPAIDALRQQLQDECDAIEEWCDLFLSMVRVLPAWCICVYAFFCPSVLFKCMIWLPIVWLPCGLVLSLSCRFRVRVVPVLGYTRVVVWVMPTRIRDFVMLRFGVSRTAAAMVLCSVSSAWRRCWRQSVAFGFGGIRRFGKCGIFSATLPLFQGDLKLGVALSNLGNGYGNIYKRKALEEVRGNSRVHYRYHPIIDTVVAYLCIIRQQETIQVILLNDHCLSASSFTSYIINIYCRKYDECYHDGATLNIIHASRAKALNGFKTIFQDITIGRIGNMMININKTNPKKIKMARRFDEPGFMNKKTST